MDALAIRGDEGRAKLRKATGSRTEALIRRSPNEETLPQGNPKGSERRELKNLSTYRKRNHRDSVSSASEPGIGQTISG